MRSSVSDRAVVVVVVADVDASRDARARASVVIATRLAPEPPSSDARTRVTVPRAPCRRRANR
jgi:hypothetical protein